jgi:hypothetical protein
MEQKSCKTCFYLNVEGMRSPCGTCIDMLKEDYYSKWVDRSIYIKKEEQEVTNEEEDVFKQMTEWLVKQSVDTKENSPTIGNALPFHGVKYDQNKPQWSLLPFEALEEVVEVLTSGAKKYAPNNWKYVPNADTRYMDAAFRHMAQYMQGEQYDEETGNNHLAHAVCCLLYKLWFDRQTEKLYDDSF